MYIEKRKNAWFLKESRYDKKSKRVKTSSAYLGSDIVIAKKTLTGMALPETDKLIARVIELDKPKPAEILSDAIEFLEKSETLANLANDDRLLDTLARAKGLLYKHKL